MSRSTIGSLSRVCLVMPSSGGIYLGGGGAGAQSAVGRQHVGYTGDDIPVW